MKQSVLPLRLVALVALGMLGLSAPVRAATTLFSGVYVQSSLASGSAQVTDSSLLVRNLSALEGPTEARAQAFYGELHTSASAQITAPFDGFLKAIATTQFEDEVTITSATLAPGTPVRLTFDFTPSGSLLGNDSDFSGIAGVTAYMSLFQQYQVVKLAGQAPTATGVPRTVFNVLVGDTIQINGYLQSSVTATLSGANWVSNYFNTANFRVVSTEVGGVASNEIGITSLSGTNYLAAPVVVPEIGTMWLTLVGVVLPGVAMWQRRKAQITQR